MHTIVRVNVKRQKGREYEGQVIETFKSMDDNELEVAIVQEEHGFPIDFSEAAIKDAEAAEDFSPGKRRDLTHCVTVTIDGETAKDFDDAISVEKKKEGGYNLKVSIADVSFFVKPGTRLDDEAYLRGTSIYFPDRCIPMLPEILSNDLCSLKPEVPRFTLTCDMDLNAKGEVTKSNIYASLIKSAARLTYTKVARLIENHEEGLMPQPIESMLKVAYELSLLVRKNRTTRGALDLDLPETEFEMDETGGIKAVRLAVRNEAHRLIEDFMILANEVVSESIEKKGYPSIYRIHEDPDPLKIERFQKTIQHWGFKLSQNQDISDAAQKFLDTVKGHKNEKMLVISLLRSLKQAHYSASNAGHFGLGSESYTHFTSPIRRYPDLMVHRILRDSNFLSNPKPPFSFEKLEEISQACSESERRAFLASRDIEDMKKARFMAPFVGKTFEGMVVSVKSFGTFVEIAPHRIEGLIPIRLLPHDYYALDEYETNLSGRRTGLTFRLGDKVRVHLSDVDRFKRQITFRFIEHLESKPKSKRRR